MVDKDKILRVEKKESGKEKEEGGKREDKRRVGRPIAEGWRRERTNSLPLTEIFKRGEKRRRMRRN